MFSTTIIIGRLTNDPVERTYSNGQGKMATFSVAVNNGSRNGEDNTTFFNCLAFGKNAENILQYFTKGRVIILDGQMQNNKGEREVNGQKIKDYGMTFIVGTWRFGDSKSDGNSGGQQQSNYQQPQQNNYQQNTGYQQPTQQTGYQQTSGQQQPAQQQPQMSQPDPFAMNNPMDFSDDDLPF